MPALSVQPKLSFLCLADNPIASLENVEFLKTLAFLDLSGCQLRRLDDADLGNGLRGGRPAGAHVPGGARRSAAAQVAHRAGPARQPVGGRCRTARHTRQRSAPLAGGAALRPAS